MTRNLPRRLERLEIRAKKIAAARPEPHTFCIVNMDNRVVSTLTWKSGESVWMHFDPPRDRAEFGPIL